MKHTLIKNQNLSENVIKSSTYEFVANILAKIGGMILTIFILSRLLGPELFGIYALTLSIISIFLTFTDLGVSSAATRYISEAIGKNDKITARSYFFYFLKLKTVLAIGTVVILLAISYPLSIVIYEKPLLFYPLIFACFYVFISSIASLPQTFLYAIKDLRKIPKIQAVEQSGRILFSLAAILIFTYRFEVPGVYLALGLSSFFVLFFSSLIVLRQDRKFFFGKRTTIEKPRILKYTGYMGLSSVSLIIFGSVDILMLAWFVDAAYLGYYKIALTLALSTSAIISGRSILLPIFTQIDKRRLQRGFKKSLRYLLMISIPSAIGLIIVGNSFLSAFYPPETGYEFASIPLFALAFLIIVASLISIYKPLFQARERPKILAVASIFALIINIILNYFFIKSFIVWGQEYALLGAAIATLISRTILLASLAYSAEKEFKISPFKRKDIFLKPLLATAAMAAIITPLDLIIASKWLLLCSQILIGTVIYFITLYSIGGLDKEDMRLLRFIPHPKINK